MPTSLACLPDSESGDVVYSDGPLSDRFPALHELVVYPLEYRQLHLMGINTTGKSTVADVTCCTLYGYTPLDCRALFQARSGLTI